MSCNKAVLLMLPGSAVNISDAGGERQVQVDGNPSCPSHVMPGPSSVDRFNNPSERVNILFTYPHCACLLCLFSDAWTVFFAPRDSLTCYT